MSDETTFYEKDGKTFFSCGCIIQPIEGVFYIKPCDLKCRVYRFCIEESKKQGNKINYVTIK